MILYPIDIIELCDIVSLLATVGPSWVLFLRVTRQAWGSALPRVHYFLLLKQSYFAYFTQGPMNHEVF